MASKKGTSPAAVVGVVAMFLAWVGGGVWYYLPYWNQPDGFPELNFAPTMPTPDGTEDEPSEDALRTDLGGAFSGYTVDSLIAEVAGYTISRSDFGVRVALYSRRDFGAAQEKADELFANRNEGRQGSVYGGFLNALGRLDREENVDGMISTLKGWKAEYPASHYPLVVEAILRMNLADAIRAGKWSTTLGRATMLGFDTNYRQARMLLEEAQTLQPEDAHPAINLMRVAAGLELSAEQISTYFDYAHERSPQSYAMWRLRLQVMAPRWGGKWQDMRDLMEEAEVQAKTNPQVELVVVDGLVQMHRRGMAGIDLTSPEQWRQVADIYDRVLKVFPDDPEILSLYANRAAEFCPDPEETARIFDRIGDHYFDGGNWESLAQYNQARTHAYIRYGREKDGPEASARIEKAYALSPDDWYVAYHYGMSRARLGDTKNSIDALLRAVNTNPSFVPAMNALAHVYLHTGDFKNAEIYANRAIVRQPLGKMLYEAESLLADAKAQSHADADGPVVPHE